MNKKDWEKEFKELFTLAGKEFWFRQKDQPVEKVLNFIQKLLQDQLTEVGQLISTHTGHDGSYCDTGEDMQWGCRSECVAMALQRLKAMKDELSS